MNKFFLIIILISFHFISFSQKCNYEIDEIDEQTQFVVKRTESVALCKIAGHPFLFKSQQIGDRKYLKLRYFRYNNFSIIEGSKLIFYFQDQTKVMLEPLKINKKTTQGGNNLSTVSSLMVYELTKDDFNVLLNNPIVEVGVYTNTGLTKKEIKDKLQNEIQNILECIN